MTTATYVNLAIIVAILVGMLYLGHVFGKFARMAQ